MNGFEDYICASIFMNLAKEELYKLSLSQVQGLLKGERNLISNLANVAAVLKENHNFFWVGFYLVEGDQLVLGPFQGPVACTRIELGKGVCGTSWRDKRSIIVPDVHEFPGHIACNANSRSEIVLPLFDKSNQVYGVLDVDSAELANFDQIDEKYLAQMTKMIGIEHV